MRDQQWEQKKPRTRRQRMFTIGIWICLGLLILWTAAVFRFIVFPTALSPNPRAEAVDAIYVLGIATEERLKEGMELIEYGVSDQLVVTVTDSNPLDRFCADDHPFTVHCVSPDPIRTRGEARQWAELVQDQQWESVMIVTMSSHATRAKLYFDRCHTGRVVVADDEVLSFSAAQWLEQSVYESGALVKFAFERGC